MKVECPGCKIFSENSDEMAHPYIGASSGCWKLYGQLLAREYSDPEYMKVHRFTVDAYAVQHPGKMERRSIQSVNSHLVALYLLIEKKLDVGFATASIGKIIEQEGNSFEWLEPPSNLGEITVTDVLKANNSEEHHQLVKSWATEVWQCWSAHHDRISDLANKL